MSHIFKTPAALLSVLLWPQSAFKAFQCRQLKQLDAHSLLATQLRVITHSYTYIDYLTQNQRQYVRFQFGIRKGRRLLHC